MAQIIVPNWSTGQVQVAYAEGGEPELLVALLAPEDGCDHKWGLS